MMTTNRVRHLIKMIYSYFVVDLVMQIVAGFVMKIVADFVMQIVVVEEGTHQLVPPVLFVFVFYSTYHSHFCSQLNLGREIDGKFDLVSSAFQMVFDFCLELQVYILIDLVFFICFMID